MSGSLKIADKTETPIVVEINCSGYKELLVEKRERVLIIKFNRPTTRNALNRRTYYELIRILQAVKYDTSVTIVAFTGVGDAFSAGNDLKETANDAAALRALSNDVCELEKKRLQLNRHSSMMLRTLLRAVVCCPKVLIALVNGVSVGIGFTLAALCDIVYCTENAYFEAPFTRLGLCPEMGASFSFPNIFGRSKSSEALIFGTSLNAAEAYQFGFVARIFKSEELDEHFWPNILKYSLLPAESLGNSKRILTAPIREALFQAIIAETETLQQLRFNKTHTNAIESFIQQRKTNKSKL